MSVVRTVHDLPKLLSLDDIEFVRYAYLTLLEREPDPDAEIYYRQQLAEGVPKFQILWEINDSQEQVAPATSPSRLEANVISRRNLMQVPSGGPTPAIFSHANFTPKILYFVDHTILCAANTGMQRTVRMLSKALISTEHELVFVKWNPKRATLTRINLIERQHLAAWNGPILRKWDLDLYPEVENEIEDEIDVAAISEAWLLVPEVTHINYHGFPTTRLLLNFATKHNLRTAFIFYDAIPLKRPELAGVADVHSEYMSCLADANVVLAISEWSKNELTKYIVGPAGGLLRDKVKALPLPAESVLGPRVTTFTKKPERLILSVGSITHHKNQLTLVKAFNEFAKKNPGSGCSLRLIGHVHPDVAHELQILLESNRKVTLIPGASDEELREAYDSCAFTVFPSLEEGFGLPIVESLWFGKPCVCANFGAMGEAGAKGGCVLVDTHIQAELEQAITSLVCDDAYRQILVNQIVQMRLDTWVDYADSVSLVLKESQRLALTVSRNGKGVVKKRVFWLGMHKVLVRTELIRLRELGYEVFNPRYLSDIKDQSAELDWDAGQESTLPSDVFKKLSDTNFFYAPLEDDVAEILNQYFDAMIVTIAPIWLEPIVKKFTGPLVYRVYGQAHSLTAELQNRGVRPYVENRDNFYFMPHAAEAISEEETWFRKNEKIVPYCLPNDVFGYMDSWDRPAQGGEVALTCPNISNAFFFAHYQYLKEKFSERFFRMYGVQTEETADEAVVGSLPRHQVLDRWTKLACYVYTYQDPRVCYLPPIEMMVIGVPVLFVKGSLLDRYFDGIDTPARFSIPEEAVALCNRIRGGDFDLIDEILSHQDPVRRRYMPSQVWPLFDRAIGGII